MFEGTSHTVIAMTTLIGGFALLIISQIQGRPLDEGTLTLITTLMAAVSGWYFGTRSTVAGAAAATSAATAATTPAEPAEVAEHTHTA